MARLIAQWVDNGIMVLVACLLLRFYFKPAVKRLYRKKWVLFACVFMILYSVVDLALAYREHFQSRVPSRSKVEETILTDGVVLSTDQVYSSRDRYEILVPAGYRRVEMKSGAVSLVAVKEGVSLLVAVFPISESLDKTVGDVKRQLKAKNSTYTFLSQQSRTFAGVKMVMLELEVTKQGIPMQGLMAMFKKGNTLFQLGLSSKKNMFPSQRAEFEKIIQSFKIE